MKISTTRKPQSRTTDERDSPLRDELMKLRALAEVKNVPKIEKSNRLFQWAALVVLCGIVAAFLSRDRLKVALHEMTVANASRRQVSFLCLSLQEKMVSAAELCTQALPQIPALRFHFQRIREQDSDWYKSHHSNYYPEVDCTSGQVVFRFLGKEFECNGAKGEERSASVGQTSVRQQDLSERFVAALLPEPAVAQESPLPLPTAVRVRKPDASTLELSRIQMANESISFGHAVSLNPLAFLPSFLSLVNTGNAAITNVRAILTLDGELLTIPLRFHAPSQAFRAQFPTPKFDAVYRFQITLQGGKTLLSENYSLPVSCKDGYRSIGSDVEDRGKRVAEALRLQQEEQQLHYLNQVIERLGGDR